MPTIKQQLHSLCQARIEERIAAIQQSINDAHAAGLEETKSSSGDKYETGRAMMHLEMEKLSSQLSEAQKLREALLKINPAIAFDKVQTGSMVYTSQGNYFVSVSAGSFTIDKLTIISLSSASPLGTKLLGLSVDSEFQWNGKANRVLAIG